MADKPLRVVSPGEKPSAGRPKTITEAASKGTHRELLVAMRDRVAKAVQDPKCPPRDLASLTRRLHEIAKEIEALDMTDPEVGAGGEGVTDEDFDASAI